MPNYEDMISMELTPAEAKESEGVVSDGEEKGPRFPHGLSLFLNDEVLDKLKATELPEVGADLLIAARVKATEISESERQGEEGPRRSVSMQITAMSIAKEERESNPGVKAKKLYG